MDAIRYSPERIAEIVAGLPAELSARELAAALGCREHYLTKMRGLNRAPKPTRLAGRTPFWARDAVADWIADRLRQEAEWLRTPPKKPLWQGVQPQTRCAWPFLGIGT